MTGCFDFRLRASPSVDLDRIQANHDASRFPMSFSKLFRSRSDGSVKTARSQSEGPTARTSSRDHRSPSPVASASAGNRRRYVRVVRSDDTRDARHASGDSAHVVVRSRSYSSTDRNRLKKSASADAGVAGGSRGAQLQRTSSPYTSSGHTILKKYNHSLDAGTGTVDNASAAGVPEVSPPNSKHASFREEVEILEYDTQGKGKCVTHTKKLNYEDEDEDDSLNIDDSFDDDIESTDFSLTEIQDETTSGSVTAHAPSPASSINKLSLEADAAAEAAMLDQRTAQENRRDYVDSQASVSAAAFDGKGLSLGTPSSALPSAVIISDQPTHEVFHSSRRSGGSPNVVESCLVADGLQLPISKSCPENDRGISTTLISCHGSSFGSLSAFDSCPENRHGSNLTFESSPGNNQDVSDHSSMCKYSPSLNHNLACPDDPSSSVSNCPSVSVSSCIRSSTCNARSSTSLGQPSTVQMAQAQQHQSDHTVDAQAFVTSGASSKLHRRPESNQKEAADRKTTPDSSSTARPPSHPENASAGTAVS